MAYDLMDLRRRIIASQPNDITREGSIVSFGTNISRPMQVTCTLSPVQSGSGDPSPSNIRPITGWTGCDVSRTGKNLFEDVIQTGGINSAGKINTSNTNDLYLAQVKQGLTYSIMSNTDNCFAFYTSKPEMSSISYNGSRTVSKTTFIAPINGWVAVRILKDYATPMLVVGETLGEYSAYTGTTIHITWSE